MIQVTAKDGGSPPKQSVLNIHISVTDINDNPPVFSKDIYNVSIKHEMATNIPITKVMANDADEGENGKVSYQISAETSEDVKNMLELNQMSGENFSTSKVTSK